MKAVWIVDDDKSIRWVLEKTLSREKIPLRSFSSATEAQMCIRDRPGRGVGRARRRSRVPDPWRCFFGRVGRRLHRAEDGRGQQVRMTTHPVEFDLYYSC